MKHLNGKIFWNYKQDKKFTELIKKYRIKGKKIVLTQGSYDLVHVGHGRYLKRAKQQGDILLVGVDSDDKVKKRKGPDRPIVPEEERLEMLTYLRHVDKVILKHADDPKWHLIKTVKPDVLVATAETYNKKQLEQLKKYCKKILVLEPQATTSTSAKIRRVQIGAAKKIKSSLSTKLIKTFEEILEELKA